MDGLLLPYARSTLETWAWERTRPQRVDRMAFSASGERKLWSLVAMASDRKGLWMGWPDWNASSGDGRRVQIWHGNLSVNMIQREFVD